MKSNLAHEALDPQGEVVQFPKKERQAMSKKEDGYTNLPNFICDEGYLSALSGEAIKCLVFLNRHIKGFHQEQKAMGEALVMKITGIKDKRTIRKYMSELEKYQLVQVVKSKGKSNVYSLTFDDRLPIELVASDAPSTSDVVTCHVPTPVACDVPTTSDMACHSVKEIYLKENIKINNKEITREEFTTQNRSMLQFIEYHPQDQKFYSLYELTQMYSVQENFKAQANTSFPRITNEQINGELKKLAQWSTTAEKRSAQKWMSTWLNWLGNFEKNQSKSKSTTASTEKPKKKYHRYGQGVINP